MFDRQCVACGEPFRTGRKRTRCCVRCANAVSQSVRLANSEARRQRICEVCCNPFVMRSPSGKARRGEVREGRFCSRVCAATWFRRVSARQGELFGLEVGR